MEIRKSTPNDLIEIMKIYDIARAYMKEHGNASQWSNGYPGEDMILNDINNGNSYVITEDGNIIGTFTFVIGVEPSYQIIRNGNWSSDRPYGTIHRLASDGRKKGISKACFDFCTEQINYVRIDTHQNNLSMQHAILSYGFKPCGNIYVRSSERIAYDYMK